MSESYSKSKLRRKRSSVQEVHLENPSETTRKRSHATSLSRKSPAKTDGSALPAAAAWWNRQQLPAVESLWAFTLKAALPYLEEQLRDPVPDFPLASAVRPAALQLDGQQWCDLGSEVSPFPEPPPPSLNASQSPEPLRLSSSQQGPSAHCGPEPDPPLGRLSARSRRSPARKTTSTPPPSKMQRPSLRSQGEAASAAGRSGAGREEARREETGPASRQLLTHWVEVPDRVSLQEDADEEEEEVQRGGTSDGGAGGRLQSCPMCLQAFPAGFTQMDCDSHLAQCLSEMNVDMTW